MQPSTSHRPGFVLVRLTPGGRNEVILTRKTSQSILNTVLQIFFFFPNIQSGMQWRVNLNSKSTWRVHFLIKADALSQSLNEIDPDHNRIFCLPIFHLSTKFYYILLQFLHIIADRQKHTFSEELPERKSDRNAQTQSKCLQLQCFVLLNLVSVYPQAFNPFHVVLGPLQFLQDCIVYLFKRPPKTITVVNMDASMHHCCFVP